MAIEEGQTPEQPSETIAIAVSDESLAQDALKWSLNEFSSGGANSSQMYLLLHVVTEVLDTGGNWILVDAATQQQVAEHVCENVLPFLETLQDMCDDYGVESSIEVVKSDDAAEAIIDAADRFFATKLVLSASDNPSPNGTLAHCLSTDRRPQGCSIVVIKDGKKINQVSSMVQSERPRMSASGRLNSSLLDLVENPDFKGTSEKSQKNREQWQKRQATRSGAMQAKEIDFQPRRGEKKPPEEPTPPTETQTNGGGEDNVPTSLQLARAAYRAGNQPGNKTSLSTIASEGSSDGMASESGPVEFAMPPPSVTRSSKLSGKLMASQKLLAASKAATGGGDGAAQKSSNFRGVKMDPKEREAKERAASNSIRVSMGQKPINLARIQSSNFREYTVDELKKAMDNFWPNHILGEGSYGIVYHGLLDGLDVAIKQLKNPDHRAALEEIDREIEVQRRCDHPNLVKLLGYSIEDRSLVYEYLSNGSLEDRLLCMGGTPPLLWPDRCRIAMEVAAALLHLHTRDPAIVHRDVKPANVLLDDYFQAKLGDVGLARLMVDMANGNTHIVRKSVIVGTEHYVDPEYLCARRGYLGPKSDVYSFGIVLLQMLVGGIPNLRKIDMAVEREELGGLLDQKAGDWPIPLAMDLANLGLWCSEMDRRDRPDLEHEVIPALLEICEAAAMEVLAREEVRRAKERAKNEEARRILEEENAAKLAAQQAAAAAAAAQAAHEAAVSTAVPERQTMNRAGPTEPKAAPQQEAPSGCCW